MDCWNEETRLPVDWLRLILLFIAQTNDLKRLSDNFGFCNRFLHCADVIFYNSELPLYHAIQHYFCFVKKYFCHDKLFLLMIPKMKMEKTKIIKVLSCSVRNKSVQNNQTKFLNLETMYMSTEINNSAIWAMSLTVHLFFRIDSK